MLALIVAAALGSPFAGLEGRWRCAGRFVASATPIASNLSITPDPASGALVVRHDDTAPFPYHSLEVWTADPGGGGLHAAVADRSGGLRVFRSPPLQGGVIAFARPEGASPKEEFRYTLKSGDVLQVDWSVARPGQPLQLGDTLTCTRQGG